MKLTESTKKGLFILGGLILFLVLHQIVFAIYPINMGQFGNKRCPLGTINADLLKEPIKTEGIKNTGLPQNKMCISYLGTVIQSLSK